jgi:hypothetical protein
VYYAEQGIPIYSLLSSIDLYDYEEIKNIFNPKLYGYIEENVDDLR